ncbi:MAG: hypothetical protein II437_04155 [Oscillospiraceae bacterium]|nr:hypothetical protein [Oscillospiraceae bacterium]
MNLPLCAVQTVRSAADPVRIAPDVFADRLLEAGREDVRFIRRLLKFFQLPILSRTQRCA